MVSSDTKMLTHSMIRRELSSGEGDVQYLRIYIRALRQKLERDSSQRDYILTEQGVGYRLKAQD